jgi:hypothetical protein
MSGNGASRSFDSSDSMLPNDPFLDKMHRGLERMDQSFDRLMDSIADLRAAMCEGFAEMHRRFDRLDQLHQEHMQIIAWIEALLVGEPPPVDR